MALVTSNPTTPQIEGITQRLLIERFLRETGLGQYGTATGGAVGTIIDTTMLQSTAYSADVNPGAWVRISYDAGGAGAAPEGEIRGITSTGYTPSSGTLAIAPNFTAAPVSGDKYQLFRYIHPQLVLDTLDQVLKEDCYLPCWTVLSEIPDYDMEQSGTTEWTGATSTLTKATAEPMGWGSQYLTVLTTAAAGYAESKVLRVVPSRKYHVSALVRANAASTTPALVAYDNTNAAVIDSKTTTSQTWVRLWLEFTTPATCNRVTIRLRNAEDATTSSWDEVAFYQVDARDFALPWWVKDKAQVKAVCKVRWQDLAGNANQWEPDPVLDIDNNRWDIRDTAFGRGQLRAVARQGGVAAPVYIFGTRNETAYANSAAETKKVDANFVVAALAYRIFLQMSAMPISMGVPSEWHKAQANRWAAEYERQRRKQSQRFEETLGSAEPMAEFYRNDWPVAGDAYVGPLVR